MNTTAITLSSITGFLFLMAGVPKVFGVPAPMGARVRTAFDRFGIPATDMLRSVSRSSLPRRNSVT
jgi:hypothetical protein